MVSIAIMHFPHARIRARFRTLGSATRPEANGDTEPMETKIEDLLRDDEPAILDEAAPTIERLTHYHRDGAEATRLRVEALYRHVARAVRARDLDDLLAHAARVARERFEAGFDLAEVQA